MNSLLLNTNSLMDCTMDTFSSVSLNTVLVPKTVQLFPLFATIFPTTGYYSITLNFMC